MAKAVGKAVPGRRRDDGHALAYVIEHLLHTAPLPLAAVQFKVKQGKLQLAHHHHAGLEIAGGQHALKHFCRQWLTGLPVAGNQRQTFGLPAPVFINWLGSSTASQATPLMPETPSCSTRVSMWCRPWPNSWNSVVTSSWVSSAGLSPTAGVKLQTR